VREVGIRHPPIRSEPINIIFFFLKVRLKPLGEEFVNNVLKTEGNGQTPELVDKICKSYLRTLFRIR